ncbi:MAG TPA: ferrochelatase [Acidimicrobiales bacterium]|nr:ferrochelatase [Acidimicrobiales bacterium]
MIAVVLMAHGAPRAKEDIEAYYTDIRHGRPPTPELLADLTTRYEAIGGLSPLIERTEAQRAAVQAALGAQWPDTYDVLVGFKHIEPRIEDAVAAAGARGIHRAVGLVLAPHYSPASVGEYHDRARTAAAGIGLDYTAVDDWHLEPAYLAFLTAAVTKGLAQLPPASKVVFTAHSLPERVVADDDPYRAGLRQTAETVAAATGLTPWGGWCVAYQSAGRTSEPWLGPDVSTVVTDLAATDGATGVLVCPCGFVADNLELLYDLDIDLRSRAEAAGLAFARTPVVNAEPGVMAALARLVVSQAADGP